MTGLRKSAEMALEFVSWFASDDHSIRPTHKAPEIAEALRQALAQPEQEPVAWMYVNTDGECEQIEYGEPFDDPSVTPLYTAPPKREWVGLTEEEVHEVVSKKWWDWEDAFDIEGFSSAIEAKLKEKNT